MVAESSGGVPPADRVRLEFPPSASDGLAVLSLWSRSFGDSLCTYHQGRRRTKKVYEWQTDHWSLTTVHKYLYDGWNVICEQVTPAGGQTSNRCYLWGLDLSNTLQGAGGVGGLLAAYTPDGNWFYAYDGNGNVTTLVSTTDGTITAQYDYSPFGLTLSQSGPAADANTYRFSTKTIDETGLYYYGFRYYNPTLGRWMSRDPIEEFGGVQLYGVIQNNPVWTVDPFGLRRFDCNTSHWHGQVGGGVLTYLSVSYDYETEECKCCKSDGSIGRYWRRYTKGTVSLAAGAGFDVDLGDLDWTWNLPLIGSVSYHLDLAFHYSLVGPAVNYKFTHEMIEDDCKNIHTGPGRICWDPSLDLGIQSIGVGNENLGLFASAYGHFQGHFCIDISESGVSLGPASGSVTATVSAYYAVAGVHHYLLNPPPVHCP